MLKGQKDFEKEMKKGADALYKQGRDALLFAHKEIIAESPADTGLYRNNHFITVNKSTNETREQKDETGSIATNRGNAIMNKLKFNHNDTITIQNNLIYASKLEAKGGTGKAPLNYARAGEKTKDFLKDQQR